MEVNPSRAVGVLVRMETYTIVESNFEFFIPPAPNRCLRRRPLPLKSGPQLQSVTSTFFFYIASHASP